MDPEAALPHGTSPAHLQDPQRFDDLLDALSHRYRRYVLVRLTASDSPIALADLATEIAAWHARSGADDSPPESEEVYLSLVHVHVPKLVDVGAVDIDSDRNCVTLRRDGSWTTMNELLDRMQ